MGTKAVYHCNQGFQLQPGEESSTECLQAGQWSNSNQPPQCVGEWWQPGAVPQGIWEVLSVISSCLIGTIFRTSGF